MHVVFPFKTQCLSCFLFYGRQQLVLRCGIHFERMGCSHLLLAGLGSITIVIVIDCNRLQLERNRNCNRNQIFQIVV